MTRSWLAVVMVMGCGAKPPEPLAPVVPAGSATDTSLPDPVVVLGAVRPEVDLTSYLPDVTRYGRWPLTVAEHPELEPHFPIASTLAQPGIGWLELCARGARSRHMAQRAELGDYLAAWCRVAQDDDRAALYQLGLLHHSIMLRDAIELDVVAILVANIAPDEAEGELRRAGLLETHVVDLASAAFFEVGKLDAAYRLNALAMGMAESPNEQSRCARHLRAIADADATQREVELEALSRLAWPRAADVKGSCVEAALDLVCAEDARCTTGPTAEDRARGLRLLETARDAWPKTAATYDTWIREADLAEHAWPYDQADRLAIAALELALRTSDCGPSRIDTIRKHVARLSSAAADHVIRAEVRASRDATASHGALAPEPADSDSRSSSMDAELAALHVENYRRCRSDLAALPEVIP